MLDVHIFDGVWGHLYTPAHGVDDPEQMYQLLSPITQHLEDSPALMYCLLLKHIRSSNNFDPTNKVYAEDLLLDIVQLNNFQTDVLPLLSEQLNDMYLLGRCAQGRTTRLFQLWCALRQ